MNMTIETAKTEFLIPIVIPIGIGPTQYLLISLIIINQQARERRTVVVAHDITNRNSFSSGQANLYNTHANVGVYILK